MRREIILASEAVKAFPRSQQESNQPLAMLGFPQYRRHLMHTYPHKIENGEGEVITFLGVVRDQDGDRMEVELLAPPNVGTPMHLHHLQEEAMTVVAGKLGLQFAGEQPRYAEAGETIILKRGVGHRWWNAGTTELKMVAGGHNA